ncbi:MltR family transcriptional regulator [Christiangramia portivictoriae]|uniref:MltR family transcriptional regulator n=1 Tax=Christiangramia portivictoriae TaxID=326069 RepID=UPI0003F87027|nr:MltR family transcriptional regulator [Christiangramia portivictoriae]
MNTSKLNKEQERNFLNVKKVRNQLNNETDRGCCLMAVSYLDFELERMLKEKLVGSKKHLNLLFDFNGPLGSFSSKINLSFSLGFISKPTLDDLNIIRKIRNEFGHSYELLNFNSDFIASRIIGLKSTFYEPGEREPRIIFLNTVSCIMAEIHSAIESDKNFQEKEEDFITNPKIKQEVRQKAEKATEELTLLIQRLEKKEKKGENS